MTSIRILSEQVINKIAAGEVIENPSSVIKELIENALDAKATVVRIEIERGGFGLIRISDDGIGMSRDDAILCLERHATSKIRDASDLFALESMGFRGEALSSIAAISKLSIWTQRSDEEVGTQLQCVGGKIISVKDTLRKKGTTFEVSNLFYNVPARKNFQKSIAASSHEIMKLVTKHILAWPHVSFYLFIDGKEIFECISSDLKQRINDVLEKPFAEKMKSIDREEEGLKIQGFIGDATQSKSNRSGQYLFINQRPIYSKEISLSIETAYGTRLPAHRFPSFVLHLTFSPACIDVNVHPQKIQVRLRNEIQLKDVLRRAIQKALDETHGEKRLILKDFSLPEKIPVFEFSKMEPQFFKEEKNCMLDVLVPLGIYRHFLFFAADDVQPVFPSLFRKMENHSGLIFLDLKRAQERLYFDKMMRLFEGEKEVEAQAFFFPEKISLSPTDAKGLKEHLETIQKLGIDIRAFGETDFIIEAAPSWIAQDMLKEMLLEFLQYGTEEIFDGFKKKKLLLAMARIPLRNASFDMVKGKELLRELQRSGAPLDSPKGKPLFLHISDEKIERLFENAT